MSRNSSYKINNLKKLKALLHGFKLFFLHILNLNKDPEIFLFRKYFFKNSLAIDIGANGADWTLSLSDMVGSEGLVLGFEPHPYFFIATKYSILYSLKKNIKLFRLGIGSQNKATNLLIYSNKKNLNYRSKISEDKINNNCNKTTSIKIKKLDSIMNSYNKNLSIIKIDVEGYEFEVLKGALKTISKFYPIIIYEVNNDKKGKENFYDIKKLLKIYGYSHYFLNKEKNLIECKKFHDFKNSINRNLIAFSCLGKYSLKKVIGNIY